MKTKMLLPTSMIVCTAIASCRPLVTETAGEKSGGEGSKEQVDMSKRMLSKEQIIEIANAEAGRHGWNPERWVTIYDEGNAYWESWLSKMKAPPPLKPLPPPTRAGRAGLSGRHIQAQRDCAIRGPVGHGG